MVVAVCSVLLCWERSLSTFSVFWLYWYLRLWLSVQTLPEVISIFKRSGGRHQCRRWMLASVSGARQPHDDGSAHAGGTVVRTSCRQSLHDVVVLICDAAFFLRNTKRLCQMCISNSPAREAAVEPLLPMRSWLWWHCDGDEKDPLHTGRPVNWWSWSQFFVAGYKKSIYKIGGGGEERLWYSLKAYLAMLDIFKLGAEISWDLGAVNWWRELGQPRLPFKFLLLLLLLIIVPTETGLRLLLGTCCWVQKDLFGTDGPEELTNWLPLMLLFCVEPSDSLCLVASPRTCGHSVINSFVHSLHLWEWWWTKKCLYLR